MTTPQEILARIEAARQRIERGGDTTAVATAAGHRRIQPALPSDRPGAGAIAVPLPGKARYTLPELCAQDGAAFVESAFSCLLGRPPAAAEAWTYLGMLMRGDSKPFVLGEILRAQPGKPLAAVEGLRARHAVQRLYRLPVIGRVLATAGNVLRLPDALRYQRMVEQQLRGQLAAVHSELAAASRLSDERAAALAQSVRESLADITARLGTTELSQEKLGARIAEVTAQLQEGLGARIAEVTAQLQEGLGARIAEATAQLQDGVDARVAALASVIDRRLGDRPSTEVLEEAAPDHLAQARSASRELGFGVAAAARGDAGSAVEGEGSSAVAGAPEDHGRPDEAERAAARRYHLFEAAFYDSCFVRVKQRIYLPYLDRALCAQHGLLDIGCGRGEFLEILRGEGIAASGIDLSPINVEHLVAGGFAVVGGEALAYLRQTERRYAAITAFQVIEHLPRGGFESLASLAFSRLVPGGRLILETVNPHAPYALANFWMDETHVAPIPPDRAAFVLQYAGFEDVRVLFSTPVPEFAIAGPEARTHYNDFAVIGRKPPIPPAGGAAAAPALG